MKCLVLSSYNYTKKDGNPGVITQIVYWGKNGLNAKTIFDPTVYSAGSVYNFEFDPNGFLICVGEGIPANSFEFLVEDVKP